MHTSCTEFLHSDTQSTQARFQLRVCVRLCVCRCCAVQVADRLNGMGVPCNLVTGQEVRRVKGARHTACTVEMADLTTRVDVSTTTGNSVPPSNSSL